MKISMRKSALKIYGGNLKNLYDSPRLECGFESRNAGHSCKKDKKSYRPWRSRKANRQAEAMIL